MRISFGSLVLVTALVGCSAGQPELIEGDNLVVLEGATLVPGNGRPVIPGSALVLQGDRILRVGRMGDFDYPPDSDVRELNGTWIVPGYIDTHGHLNDPEMPHLVLRMMVAHGITTVRVAAGFGPSNAAVRDSIARGDLLGPRLRTAGIPIDEADGPFDWMSKVESEEEMRAEVRRQVDVGVDYIKLYRTVRPALAAVAVDEAHRLGARVIGHLNLTTWEQAAAMGMDGVVHAGVYSPMWEFLPEDQWETVRTTFNEFGVGGELRGFRLLTEGIDVESPAFARWAARLEKV